MTSTKNHTVWIVEDDPDDRALLNQAVKDTHIPCEVSLFTDAVSALQKLDNCSARELPAIIVTDYNMHIMSGGEFIEVLSSYEKYDHIIKIILSTGSYLFDTEECLQKGADAYFLKPVSYPQLVDVAFSILAIRK
jgi:CheY-like chemotaxis protein